MRITGIYVQYYKVCKTELWYFAHRITPPQDYDSLRIGKFIGSKYKRREKLRDIVIDDSICIDILDSEGNVIEIKKSGKMNEPKIYQLYYYLLKLKRKGIFALGKISVPIEKKIINVHLSSEIEKELEIAEAEIEKIISQKTPPPPQKKPYCKRCAYYELCWS